ncbi:MAG TPA: hypothetical protein VGZ02_09265 [Candidatus Baltobacteraceae bacterium]|jgi:hypothetical protein|nr:hypothetical protein [Candidatus Baltobacteraceae bacterium]
MRRNTLRWGIAFIGVTAIAIASFLMHEMKWDREFTLLNQSMQVNDDRSVTGTFAIPVDAPYEMDIYVQSKVPYADCLLGQGGYLEERCSRYQRVIDVASVLHGEDGHVLAHGLSGGTCCSYTTDDNGRRVVYTTLDTFQLPAGTKAYLELKHRRDASKLQYLSPRIVVERSDPEDSELGLEVWSFLGIGVLLIMDLILVMKGWMEYRAFRAPTRSRQAL